MLLICFPDGSVVKNLPASAGDTGDTGVVGSMPGLERCPTEGNGNSTILAWKIPRTERGAGGLPSMKSQKVGHGWAQ